MRLEQEVKQLKEIISNMAIKGTAFREIAFRISEEFYNSDELIEFIVSAMAGARQRGKDEEKENNKQ